MSWLEFSDDTYRSEPRSIPLRARLCPSFSLYLPFLRIVLHANRCARRNRFDDDELCRSTHTCLKLLERLGIAIEITGINHIRDLNTACVIIANHMSALETVVLPVIIHPFRPLTFIVKQSLLTYPVFGPIMRALNPVSVTRTHPRQDLKTVLEEGANRIREGLSIVVFPQTTRTVRFDPARFSSIGVKLAHRAGVPVVPLALKTDAWGNGKYLKDFGPVDPSKEVRFAFGPPMMVQKRGAEEQQETVDFIQQCLREWGVAPEAGTVSSSAPRD